MSSATEDVGGEEGSGKAGGGWEGGKEEVAKLLYCGGFGPSAGLEGIMEVRSLSAVHLTRMDRAFGCGREGCGRRRESVRS